MRRKAVVAITATVALLVALGVVLFATQDPPGTAFPARAAATYPDDSSVATFRSVGELVATAAFVVEGEVVDVKRGESVRLADGSGAEIVPRLLVVKVRELLHNGDPRAGAPESLRVTDGYWEDGVGYEREPIGWARPGQVGFFLVSRDRAPDGTLVSTYSPLSSSGIALLDGDRVKYAHQGVWQRLGNSATEAEFREALSEGISAARSGAAKPITVTICYPSRATSNQNPFVSRSDDVVALPLGVVLLATSLSLALSAGPSYAGHSGRGPFGDTGQRRPLRRRSTTFSATTSRYIGGPLDPVLPGQTHVGVRS